MADDVSRKISKLRDEGMEQDQAVAAAMEMTDSPPQGVQGFTQTPNAGSGPPDPPDKFTQTPDRSDPETASPAGARNRADAAEGPPEPVQEFGSGAEQRGVTPRTLRADVDTSMPDMSGDAKPDAVQEFSDAEV